jgi:AraC-like DNA-binding protein
VVARITERRTSTLDEAWLTGGVFSLSEETNRRLLRARDAMDANFRSPLPITELAAIAAMSDAHFVRTFKATFGETPHRYLQRRRIERAMYLLRTTDRSVTDICMEVGWSSLGTFSRTFTDIVGTPPSEFRRDSARGTDADRSDTRAMVPSCFVQRWTRPTSLPDQSSRSSSFGEATHDAATVRSPA